jgi:hypothetical protein
MKTLRCWRGVFLLVVLTMASTAMLAQSVGEVYASDAAIKGTVLQSGGGLEVGNGSVVTAGDHSATLRLARGGQVRICPRTNLTVNSSPKGQELMFAMSAGSLEGEYQLPATADAVLTPDFRILISGPARVDISIGASESGITCVHSRGQESYIVVSELMGDDFYRVKPNEQVIFRAGHAKDPEVNSSAPCGCPAAAPMERLTAAAPVETPAPTPEQTAGLEPVQKVPAVAATANAAAALPPEASGPVQVQVDAPMVFQGTGTPPDVTSTLARVHVERLPWPDTPEVKPEPPSRSSQTRAQPATSSKKGFFHRLVRALFG